ncbi:NRDE family protein [Bacillus sp. HMF5848]|uniref:NRDE family protein n=1 Tax=Bacillus sp. HMF5848 TaxID=2495421 RepID=UPI000F79659C|nr:NRDE family protein [Bacillus sp. HMF5848]RSK27213.1 NRDE family protein [Bacillus sp. HMF5848]
MCLILFAYKVNLKYPLIVAANRDEIFQRPTASLHYWEDYPEIVAGRDLEKSGTWLGVTNTGRFAALTNYRNPREQTDGLRSRGELVTDFLKGNDAPENFLVKIHELHTSYPGFNLLVGSMEDLYYYSNVEQKIKQLTPGIYGLSNALLNTNWPKVERGTVELKNLIKTSCNKDITKELIHILQDAEGFSDEKLPHTGVSIDWERMLAPIFIKSDNYGTRSSTVVLMCDKTIQITERVYTDTPPSQQTITITL